MSQSNLHGKQGIVIQPTLSIRWRSIKPGQSEDIQSYNHTTFQIIEALEEHHAGVKESRDTHSQDYMHLDAKLNLLIDLLGQLLNQQSAPPVSQPVQLSMSGLQWLTSQTPRQGELLIVELFLDKRHGRSIHLSGKVVSVKPNQNESIVQVIFDTMDESTRLHLEKWIFRVHRREVASKRNR